jgi:hypothetical protein
MIRAALTTVLTALLGLPACAAIMLGVVTMQSMKAPDAMFTVIIGATALWNVLLFAALWLAFGRLEKTG